MKPAKTNLLWLFILTFSLISFSSFTVVAQSFDDEDSDTVVENTREEFFADKNDWNHLAQEQRRIPGEEKEKLKKNKSFWYADYNFGNEEEKKLNAPVTSYVPLLKRTWFQTLIWLVIIAGFVAAIIWFLAGSQVNIFRRKDSQASANEGHETMPEDIFSIQYQIEIDKAVKIGNYRLAIRLMFLELLKNMTERNIIHFKQDKTNLDYLMDLQPTVYYKPFFRVARNYEYSWYGEFGISREMYDLVSEDFKQLERQLR